MPSCIFCGETKVTKEHIWGKWAQKYLPATNEDQLKRYPHQINIINKHGQFEVGKGVFDNVGDPLSKTTKVVCNTCNNEWGSSIENDMEDAFSSIFVRHKLESNANRSTAIIRWLFQKNCLHERACPIPFNPIAPRKWKDTLEKERLQRWKSFRERNEPPKGYKFFMGLSGPRTGIGHNFVFRLKDKPAFDHNEADNMLTSCLLFLGTMQSVITNDEGVIKRLNNMPLKSKTAPIAELVFDQPFILNKVMWRREEFEDAVLSAIDQPEHKLRRNYKK